MFPRIYNTVISRWSVAFFTFNSGKFVWKTHKNPPDPGLVEGLVEGWRTETQFSQEEKGSTMDLQVADNKYVTSSEKKRW